MKMISKMQIEMVERVKEKLKSKLPLSSYSKKELEDVKFSVEWDDLDSSTLRKLLLITLKELRDDYDSLFCEEVA
ncbi:MAG: hypothetical protein ABF331_02900 [Hellea sp.]